METFLKCLGACAAMAVASWAVIHRLPGPLFWRVGWAVIAGVGIYFALTRAMGMDEFHHLMHAMRRSKTQTADSPQ